MIISQKVKEHHKLILCDSPLRLYRWGGRLPSTQVLENRGILVEVRGCRVWNTGSAQQVEHNCCDVKSFFWKAQLFLETFVFAAVYFWSARFLICQTNGEQMIKRVRLRMIDLRTRTRPFFFLSLLLLLISNQGILPQITL